MDEGAVVCRPTGLLEELGIQPTLHAEERLERASRGPPVGLGGRADAKGDPRLPHPRPLAAPPPRPPPHCLHHQACCAASPPGVRWFLPPSLPLVITVFYEKSRGKIV